MNLSTIKYSDILLKSDESDLEKIVFDTENDQLKEKCDVGIVFGGISMIPHRIDQAINLYIEGYINKILVTGGIGFLNIDRKTPEAYKMYDCLTSFGIPKKDILIEPNSRNSFENIQYSLEVLKELYNLNNTKLALITSDFHLKRCLNMAAQQYDKNNLYGSGARDGKTDIVNWKKSLYGKKTILQEALLLCYYAKNQKIDDLNIKQLKFKNLLF